MKISIGAKTIAFPIPVFIIGTYDKAGKANAAAVAWGGICCSDPPCVAISLREATYTYGNIVHRKAFTISIPSEEHIKQADYFGITSGKNEDKFAVTGLTPVKSDIVDAPYIKEFPFIIECELFHTIKLGLHTQFIGQVKDIKADQDVVNKDGTPDIEKIKPFSFDFASRAYYANGRFLAKAFTVGRDLKK